MDADVDKYARALRGTQPPMYILGMHREFQKDVFEVCIAFISREGREVNLLEWLD